jgi:hypothetical protein
MYDPKRDYPVPMTDARAEAFDREVHERAWELVRDLEIAYPELGDGIAKILVVQCLMKAARYTDQSN